MADEVLEQRIANLEAIEFYRAARQTTGTTVVAVCIECQARFTDPALWVAHHADHLSERPAARPPRAPVPGEPYKAEG